MSDGHLPLPGGRRCGGRAGLTGLRDCRGYFARRGFVARVGKQSGALEIRVNAANSSPPARADYWRRRLIRPRHPESSGSAWRTAAPSAGDRVWSNVSARARALAAEYALPPAGSRLARRYRLLRRVTRWRARSALRPALVAAARRDADAHPARSRNVNGTARPSLDVLDRRRRVLRRQVVVESSGRRLRAAGYGTVRTCAGWSSRTLRASARAAAPEFYFSAWPFSLQSLSARSTGRYPMRGISRSTRPPADASAATTVGSRRAPAVRLPPALEYRFLLEPVGKR